MAALPPPVPLIRGYGIDMDNLKQVVSAYRKHIRDAQEYITNDPPDNARHQEAIETAKRLKADWFENNPNTQNEWDHEMDHQDYEGGRRKQKNRSKLSKRKTSKRKSNKRKTSKRKSRKRKTNKRKTSKRKSRKRR